MDDLAVEVPSQLMMDVDDLIQMINTGMDIGRHSIYHPILTATKPNDAQLEVDGNKKELEEIFGKQIELFAYHHGKSEIDYNTQHMQIVRNAGYAATVMTNWGFANIRSS